MTAMQIGDLVQLTFWSADGCDGRSVATFLGWHNFMLPDGSVLPIEISALSQDVPGFRWLLKPDETMTTAMVLSRFEDAVG